MNDMNKFIKLTSPSGDSCIIPIENIRGVLVKEGCTNVDIGNNHIYFAKESPDKIYDIINKSQNDSDIKEKLNEITESVKYLTDVINKIKHIL